MPVLTGRHVDHSLGCQAVTLSSAIKPDFLGVESSRLWPRLETCNGSFWRKFLWITKNLLNMLFKPCLILRTTQRIKRRVPIKCYWVTFLMFQSQLRKQNKGTQWVLSAKTIPTFKMKLFLQNEDAILGFLKIIEISKTFSPIRSLSWNALCWFFYVVNCDFFWTTEIS